MAKARHLAEVRHPEANYPVCFSLHEYCERYVADRQLQKSPPYRDPKLYTIHTVPTCACCGWFANEERKVTEPEAGHVRCEKHVGRNPCIIDGCGRTFDNDGHYTTRFVCGKHWRMAPAELRKSVKRIEKMAKKIGWKLVLRKRHTQLWDRAIKRIEGVLAGDIDMEEINKLMGWD